MCSRSRWRRSRSSSAGLAVADLAAGWAMTAVVGAARGRGVPVAHEHVRGARHAARRARAARSRSRASARGARPGACSSSRRSARSSSRSACTTRYFMDVYREAFGRIASETGHATAAAGGRTPLTRLVELPRGLALTFGVPGCCSRSPAPRSSPSGPHRRRCSGSLAMWLAVCGLLHGRRHRHPGRFATPARGSARDRHTDRDRIRRRVADAARSAARSGSRRRAGWLWVCAISWTGALGH